MDIKPIDHNRLKADFGAGVQEYVIESTDMQMDGSVILRVAPAGSTEHRAVEAVLSDWLSLGSGEASELTSAIISALRERTEKTKKAR